jgi:hypothetical protein
VLTTCGRFGKKEPLSTSPYISTISHVLNFRKYICLYVYFDGTRQVVKIN